MKRLLFIAVAGMLFTSCSKSYKCSCAFVTRGTSQTTTKEFDMAVSKKNTANTKCLQYQTQYNEQFGVGSAGVAQDVTCTVK
ncbi:MAG: hypothetical protein EOP56_14655 [Sphingobacteriales bacterium]|nr:MAG: hypothetical protein EOP56_14655 [Sphingobacteriales bacterium]